VGEPLLAGLEPDQVNRITVRDGEGEQVVLAKGADGWVLADAGDYPCQENVVPDLLEKLTALRTDRLVAQTRASHERLQVSEDAFVSQVELDLADGNHYALYLGSSPSYSAIHVRVAGQDQVYLASGISSADVSARPSTWIDTLYFSVQQDQLVAATLQNPNGLFEFSKDEGGTWTMAGLTAGETASSNNITSLINRAASVRMLRPLGTEAKAEYGMDDPYAVLVLHVQEPEGTRKTYTLYVGAKSEEDGSYVLKSSESPYYVWVAEYVAQDWVGKARDELLEQPPTPTPES
jgi:hypothetical protein